LGDIYLTNESGVRTQLTRIGKDVGPVLSPDGKVVAFLRTLISAPEKDEDGVYELRILEIHSQKGALLSRPPQVASLVDTWTTSPQGPLAFSPNSGVVYFLRREAQTSNQVVAVDRRSGTTHVVVTGISEYQVISHGRYTGYILAAKRSPHESGVGFVYPWCIFDLDGHEVHRYPTDVTLEKIESSL
jgi:predicted RNA-binding protein YlqC (UPF0109 family)